MTTHKGWSPDDFARLLALMQQGKRAGREDMAAAFEQDPVNAAERVQMIISEVAKAGRMPKRLLQASLDTMALWPAPWTLTVLPTQEGHPPGSSAELRAADGTVIYTWHAEQNLTPLWMLLQLAVRDFFRDPRTQAAAAVAHIVGDPLRALDDLDQLHADLLAAQDRLSQDREK